MSPRTWPADPEGAQEFADAVAELADLRAELLLLAEKQRSGATFMYPAPRDVRADAHAAHAQAAALRVAVEALRR